MSADPPVTGEIDPRLKAAIEDAEPAPAKVVSIKKGRRVKSASSDEDLDDQVAGAPHVHVDPDADHVDLARALVTFLGGRDLLVFDELHPARYDAAKGLWLNIDRAEESRIVQAFSGSSNGGDKVLRIKASDVAGAIKLAHDQIAKPDFFATAPRGLVFANGFVSITAEGATLRPHAPENRARAGYPFPFDVDARPSLFLEFLGALFRDDADRDAKALFVQEFFGACLAGLATVYQRCVIGQGVGDNGKSRLADIMTAAMPAGTTSALAPQSWGHEYYRAMLVGKRLNAVGELPERDIIASESFKAIVAGDPIGARVIRESPLMFRPIAGHYFAANKLPGTQDQSEGFWRRFVVLTFNRSFTDDPTRDPNVHTRILAAELPAIVSWLVAGAVRLLRQSDYTIPSSHARSLAAWRKDADQVALFLVAETRPLRDDETEHMGLLASDLYSSYVEWARRNGHRPVASNTFGARLRGLGRAAKRTKAGMRYLVSLLSVVEKAALGADEEASS